MFCFLLFRVFSFVVLRTVTVPGRHRRRFYFRIAALLSRAAAAAAADVAAAAAVVVVVVVVAAVGPQIEWNSWRNVKISMAAHENSAPE